MPLPTQAEPAACEDSIDLIQDDITLGVQSVWVVYFDADPFPGEVVAMLWLEGDGKRICNGHTLRVDMTVVNPEATTGAALKEAYLRAIRTLIKIVKPSAERHCRREGDDSHVLEYWK